MAQRRNVFTKIGRPKTPSVKPIKDVSGQTQGLSPMDNFDTRIPARAFACGGSVKTMPKYHDTPGFCSGGSSKRR